MLHSESRKDCAKNHRPLAIACLAFVLIAGCADIPRETEEQRVARMRTQLLSDSAQDAHKHLGQILSLEKDSLEADLLVRDYYNNGGDWVWVTTDTMLLLQKADSMASFLSREASSMGFAPDAFFTKQIAERIDHIRKMDFDSTATDPVVTLASLELTTSRAFMRYAQGQRYGFVNPENLFNHLDLRSGGGHRRVFDLDLEKADDQFTKEALLHANEPVEYLKSLEPDDKIYSQLKDKLAADTTTEGKNRIMSNMERRRWRHKVKIAERERHVFVNIPSLKLWAIAPDSAFDMKICCGAWATKTPLLESNIRLIQLNPEWRIPFNIVRDEVSRHGGDSAYFARNRYYITKSSTGETVSAKNVTAQQLRAGGYRVTQHSGAGNSLGRIIFRFPNQFDVYLHDTNNRRAFNAERRAISHGCIRVERPFDLVKFLLPDATEQELDKMRMSIDMKPVTEWGKSYLNELTAKGSSRRLVSSKDLPQSVPVVIDYYTFYPNPVTGEWETWPDRYEYDKQIMKKIKPFLP